MEQKYRHKSCFKNVVETRWYAKKPAWGRNSETNPRGGGERENIERRTSNWRKERGILEIFFNLLRLFHLLGAFRVYISIPSNFWAYCLICSNQVWLLYFSTVFSIIISINKIKNWYRIDSSWQFMNEVLQEIPFRRQLKQKHIFQVFSSKIYCLFFLV